MMQSSADLRGLTWQELEITAPEAVSSELEIFLTDCRLGGWVVEAEVPSLRLAAYLPCSGEWEERLHNVESGVRSLGGEFRVRRSVVDEDWAECWKKFYHPKRFGKSIVVCPSWEKFDAQPSDKVITLDPGMAFGTGLHASTAMCLEMMEELFAAEHPDSVIDVGTGSGILAIAARLLGADRIEASDSDPVAVKSAAENFVINGLTDSKPFEYVGVPSDKGRFNLVCANLVASLLCRLAPALDKAAEPSGSMVLSGIVEERCQDVIDEFAALGWNVHKRLEQNTWVCLWMKR